MTQLLCFGLPHDIDNDVPKIRSKLAGSSDPKSSLQIVSSFEWSKGTSVATFLLPRTRAMEFMNKGYEVAIFDHMFWRITSTSA